MCRVGRKTLITHERNVRNDVNDSLTWHVLRKLYK